MISGCEASERLRVRVRTLSIALPRPHTPADAQPLVSVWIFRAESTAPELSEEKVNGLKFVQRRPSRGTSSMRLLAATCHRLAANSSSSMSMS